MKKKEENLQSCRFCCPRLQKSKIEKGERKDQYLGLARELKNWNMNVTIIPIVFGVIGSVIKGLVKGLENLEIKGPYMRQSTLQPCWGQLIRE